MDQFHKQVKVIQSRLGRKKTPHGIAEIKAYLQETRPEMLEFSEEELSQIVSELSGSTQMVPAADNEILTIDEKPEPTDSALTVGQKQEIIQQVATTLEVSLSLEQVEQISQKMNWAVSDRASIKDRIQSAIVAWIDYQFDQDLRQTDDMMQAVEGHLVKRLQESNQHFADKSTAFSNRVGQSVEEFRTTETAILGLFKIPR